MSKEQSTETSKRYATVIEEIKLAIPELSRKSFLCGVGFNSDVFKVNGREMQIQVMIQADEYEFEEPTKSFISKQ